jgi:hypothetical protein
VLAWAEAGGGEQVCVLVAARAGGQVAELVRIRLTDVDLDGCRIRIT